MDTSTETGPESQLSSDRRPGYVPKHRKYKVFEFTSAGGARVPNVTEYLYPFRLMQIGDWFDVADYQADLDAVADSAHHANDAAAGIRFKTRARRVAGGHEVLRVTRVALRPPKAETPTARPLAAARDAIGGLAVGQRQVLVLPAVAVLRAVREAQLSGQVRYATQRTRSAVVVTRTL